MFVEHGGLYRLKVQRVSWCFWYEDTYTISRIRSFLWLIQVLHRKLWANPGERSVLASTRPKFMEPKILYRPSIAQVPISNYTLPSSKTKTLILGNDLTVLTYRTPIYICERHGLCHWTMTSSFLWTSEPPKLGRSI